MRNRTRGERARATLAAVAVAGLALTAAVAPSSALPTTPTPPTAPPSPTTSPPPGADPPPDTAEPVAEAGAPVAATRGLAAPAPQVHYLPFRADHLWDVLDAQLGGNQLPEQSVRLVASLAAPRDGTVVAVDTGRTATTSTHSALRHRRRR